MHRGVCIAALLAFALAGAAPAHADLSYADFESVDGLTLNGSAARVDNRLRLTPAAADQGGSAFTTATAINPGESFSTHFSAQLHGGTSEHGDGLAFVVQNDPRGAAALGTHGQLLGYGHVEGHPDAISPSLAVELDTYNNSPTSNDPSANHVAIATGGASRTTVASASPDFEMYGADAVHVWVDYDAGADELRVYVDDTDVKPAAPLLVHSVDLHAHLAGPARAGFTAGTGGAYAIHDVHSWALTTTAATDPDFTGFTLNGAATLMNDRLRLTDGENQGASAFTTGTVVDPNQSFSTRFAAQIHGGSDPHGDGLAFVIQTDARGASALGTHGGRLGYGFSDGNPAAIAPSIAVELDTHDNSTDGLNDPNGNHLGIAVNGDTNTVAAASPDFSMYGASAVYVWIDYDAFADQLRVYVDDTDTKPGTPLLTRTVDLQTLLGGPARAGFTAGTGGFWEIHDVLSWSFEALNPSSTTVACSPAEFDLGAETSCTATVSDTAATGKVTPTGEVAFGSAATGSCTLEPSTTTGVARCSTTFQPPAAGSHTVSATWPGDAAHSGSSGSTSVTATPPPTYTVNTLADGHDENTGDGECEKTDGQGDCTLRAAIDSANATSTVDTERIEFSVTGTHLLDPALGQLVIAGFQYVTLAGNGAGPDGTVVSGGDVVRVLMVDQGFGSAWQTTVTLADLRIRDGFVGHGSSTACCEGAGVRNGWGTLLLERAAVIDNTINIGPDGATGAGISSSGPVAIADSAIEGNTIQSAGGTGAALASGDYYTLVRSTVAGNSTGSDPFSGVGGIYQSNFRSTPSVIANSTLSGNTGGSQNGTGAVFSGSKLEISNSTIAGNSGGRAGGLFIQGSGDVTATIRNSILASTSGPACLAEFGAAIAGDHSIDDGTSCGFGTANGNRSSTDPLLGPLADNGGPTKTRAPAAASPAIDGGDAATCAAAPVGGVDQRGVARPQGAACDIGAVERQGTPAATAAADSETVDEDAAATTIDVLANDSAGGETVTSVTQPSHGTAAVATGGTAVTYTPAANYCNDPGEAPDDTFTYTLTGGSSATVSVTVNCLDDPPAAVADSTRLDEDSSATTVDVLANDTDLDAGSKTVTSVTQPSHGTAAVATGGTAVTYTPAANYCNAPGEAPDDTFTYTLTGGSTATVSVEVTCLDDAPLAVADTETVGEDAPATTIEVLGNDTDLDGGPKTVTSVTQPSHGTAAVATGGTAVTYTPAANYCNDPGEAPDDTFTYTLEGGSTTSVAVTVTCVDDPPVAVADSKVIVEDAPATAIDVLDNDTDVDAGPRTITAVTQAGHGSVVITNSGADLTYAPAANYCNDPGAAPDDAFTYTLEGGSTATVTVTVTCVEDAASPVNDSATVAEDAAAITVDVLANDPAPESGPKRVTAVTQPAHGTAAIAGDGANVTYRPAADYCNEPGDAADDTFTYTLSGGSAATVSMTVTCADDPPVAVADVFTVPEDSGASTLDVLANDTDVDGGAGRTVASVTQPSHGTVAITESGSRVTYTPTANYCNDPGEAPDDSFTYTLASGATTAVGVKVSCSDDPPVAVADSTRLDEDSSATTVDVLANDTDVDAGAGRTVASVTQPSHGTVAITESGSRVTYTPAANYCNAPGAAPDDAFTYTINGGSTATVSVEVTCLDDPPIAVADTKTVGEDASATTIEVLANDTDLDGGPKKVTSVTQPARGTAAVAAEGASVTYAPAADYCNDPGEAPDDTFTYTLEGGSTTSVAVKVSCVNDPPRAVDDPASVQEDSGLNLIDVLTNDVDPDGGDTKQFDKRGQPSHGTSEWGGGNNLAYTPDPNYCNDPGDAPDDTFTYSLMGGSQATVRVRVVCVDDAPVAVDDTATVDEDGEVTVDVTANDTDIDGGAAPKVVAVSAGAATIADEGRKVTYRPPGDVCTTGDDRLSFSYELAGGSRANVRVKVNCVEDPAVAVADSKTVAEDAEATQLSVTGNDVDPDRDDQGRAKVIAAVTQPAHGSVDLVFGGQDVRYKPAANYCNDPGDEPDDTFTYTLEDGSTTAVSVKVTCVNDRPQAVADAVTLAEDSGYTEIDVVGNDTDVDGGDEKRALGVGGAENGHARFVDGRVEYRPNSAYCGDDGFSYTLSGGSTARVEIAVTCDDDPPIAFPDRRTVEEDSPAQRLNVLANDLDDGGAPKKIVAILDPNGNANGTVEIVPDGSDVTYRPRPDYCTGEGEPPGFFTYRLEGGSIAHVDVVVTCEFDDVRAVDDQETTNEDSPTGIWVTLNDRRSDAGAEPTVASLSRASHGELQLSADREAVSYTPNPNYCNDPGAEPDRFTYSLENGSTATVSVKVRCVEDRTAAQDDAIRINEDAAATIIDVRRNDDPEGTAEKVAALTQSGGGTTAIADGGDSVSYRPDPGYCNEASGTDPNDDAPPDVFRYTLSGGTSAAVRVTVVCQTSVPHPPRGSYSCFERDVGGVKVRGCMAPLGTTLVGDGAVTVNGIVLLAREGTGRVVVDTARAEVRGSSTKTVIEAFMVQPRGCPGTGDQAVVDPDPYFMIRGSRMGRLSPYAFRSVGGLSIPVVLDLLGREKSLVTAAPGGAFLGLDFVPGAAFEIARRSATSFQWRGVVKAPSEFNTDAQAELTVATQPPRDWYLEGVSQDGTGLGMPSALLGRSVWTSGAQLKRSGCQFTGRTVADVLNRKIDLSLVAEDNDAAVFRAGNLTTDVPMGAPPTGDGYRLETLRMTALSGLALGGTTAFSGAFNQQAVFRMSTNDSRTVLTGTGTGVTARGTVVLGSWGYGLPTAKVDASPALTEFSGAGDFGFFKGDLSGWIQPTPAGRIGVSGQGTVKVGSGSEAREAPGELAFNGRAMAACGEAWDGYRFGVVVDAPGGQPRQVGPGCDVGPYRSLRPARVESAQAGGHAFAVPKGSRAVMVAVRGRGGAPKLTLTGPGGRAVQIVSGNVGRGAALEVSDADASTTYLLVREPEAGEWAVAPAEGSTELEEVRVADGLPPASVRAKVTGTGSSRALVWKLTPIRGQVVRFYEEADGVAAELGATPKAAGTLRFNPAPGPAGTRRIVALVEQDGLPRARLVVATYRATARKLAAPRRVTLKRKGLTLDARWPKVRGAHHYEVTVAVGGRRVKLTGESARMSIPGVAKTARGSVSVRAVDAGNRRGAPRSVPLGRRK